MARMSSTVVMACRWGIKQGASGELGEGRGGKRACERVEWDENENYRERKLIGRNINNTHH